jgi:hypothetical protein
VDQLTAHSAVRVEGRQGAYPDRTCRSARRSEEHARHTVEFFLCSRDLDPRLHRRRRVRTRHQTETWRVKEHVHHTGAPYLGFQD